jgi:hypothetical protein
MTIIQPKDHLQSADAYRTKADESASEAAAAPSPLEANAALKKQNAYTTLAENDQCRRLISIDRPGWPFETN